MLETVETTLENARQRKTTVQLVLGGRIESPYTATVLNRNGPTFEFLIDGITLHMEVSHVILRMP